MRSVMLISATSFSCLASTARAVEKSDQSVTNLRANCKNEIKNRCKKELSTDNFLPQCIAKYKSTISKSCNRALEKYLKDENIDLEVLTTPGE